MSRVQVRKIVRFIRIWIKKLAVQFDKAPKLYWLGIGKDDFFIKTMQLIALIWIKKDINMSLWKLLVDMYGPAGVFISLYLLPSCLNKSD